MREAGGLNSFNIATLCLYVLHFCEEQASSHCLFLEKKPYWAFIFLILDRNMSTEKYFSTIRGKRFRQSWGLIGSGGDWGRLESTSLILKETGAT